MAQGLIGQTGVLIGFVRKNDVHSIGRLSYGHKDNKEESEEEG